MPFNHNDCYHPLLLRHLPEGARTALDVGCGGGRFARGLAARGLDVTAVDPATGMIDIARALGSRGTGSIEYRTADITAMDLPEGHYDFISCLASLHHVPFSTVSALRAALAPGGVLVVLGLARPSAPGDWAKWLSASPVNMAARLLVHAGERINGGSDPHPQAPVRHWSMTMNGVRREADRLLPGSTVRTLLFWRYLLTYRAE
ncbi:methyltransferase [Prauserella marina]|uniref:Methyltransferase domain-containing protein n=1 Tax=Prauserella marina TaxID=530584 RepID=A0A222VMA4_9PSEU|nr:class I SAM-dependent methyltransferase [Prauserella marina]ASR35060.1 methyltransferase [Prauserella marina]PWV85198.1 methyltransferase family protein [Prauserella marina]SDC02555.1 Methyltransferase domain-containing protein [Prauserella marina]